MQEREKEKLLEDIEELLAYGEEKPTIDPALLKYLDIKELSSIRDRLREKTKSLKDEDKEWLQRFRKSE